METMHFHIANTNLFLGQLCFAFGGPIEQFGTHEKLTWGCRVGLIECLGITLDMLFSSGKCNFSYPFFCITATTTKPMTVLRALAYYEFDFPFDFLLLRKVIKQICNKMFTIMIIIFFFFFSFFVLSLEKLLVHTISFSKV